MSTRKVCDVCHNVVESTPFDKGYFTVNFKDFNDLVVQAQIQVQLKHDTHICSNCIATVFDATFQQEIDKAIKKRVDEAREESVVEYADEEDVEDEEPFDARKRDV